MKEPISIKELPDQETLSSRDLTILAIEKHNNIIMAFESIPADRRFVAQGLCLQLMEEGRVLVRLASVNGINAKCETLTGKISY